MKQALAREFWKKKQLEELSQAEWEALCDGCGKCCLLKLEDDETGHVYYTDIACRLFDDQTCRCGNYALRKELVPQCVVLTPQTVRESIDWMPRTCAYRLLAEGYDLYPWHPLVSGDAMSVHDARISVRAQTVPEYEVPEDEQLDHVIEGGL
ncbi:MAG: YcgN family cysteine cluster protein [Neomegalonema sp.]|nr:YcgN family cysteine cluster protein [Neomegalonema sp.]